MTTNKLPTLALMACLAASCIQSAVGAEPPERTNISAALADASRPQADRDRDAARKPAELIAFAGIQEGSKVADLFPGRGYFTRIFSTIVGPTGRVYALSVRESESMKTFADTHPNVTFTVEPPDQFTVAEPLDVAWTSLNYHDLANRGGTKALNQFVFRSLKPGGLYIVIDHSAAAEAPADVTSTLHRIDEETVKKQVTEAGFELVEQSDVLRNPDDPRTAHVRDASIRGRTDQFVLKFRKPAD